MAPNMKSDQEKLERLDKFESYVCKANMIAMIAAVVAGAVGVFHKDIVVSICSGVIAAGLVSAASGAVMWMISKAKDRVLDRIWGG